MCKLNIYHLCNVKRIEQDNISRCNSHFNNAWKLRCSAVSVICTCDQCDSAFCALQLTSLIKSNWCVLLYCCACLHPNTTLMEIGWTTVPCPATNLSILICKSFARTKQSMISVALKTHLETKLESVYIKRHFCIDPMIILVSHQAVSPHFTTKLSRWPQPVVIV